MKRYLVVLWGGVEVLSPQGPYPSHVKRMEAAKKLHTEMGENDAIFALDIHKNGIPETWSFSGGCFDERTWPGGDVDEKD